MVMRLLLGKSRPPAACKKFYLYTGGDIESATLSTFVDRGEQQFLRD
jgi:hypothetical protein